MNGKNASSFGFNKVFVGELLGGRRKDGVNESARTHGGSFGAGHLVRVINHATFLP